MKTRDSIGDAAMFLAVITLVLTGNSIAEAGSQEDSSRSPATEQVLYSFMTSQGDGRKPSGLVSDSAGNLYGVTYRGGSQEGGAVFELMLESGVWTEKILYNFHFKDGTRPLGNLIFDKAGNLYGTTRTGGLKDYPACVPTCGTVFELSPQPGGNWKETVLHKFTGYPHDGWAPAAGMVFDGLGNLYGTTEFGGKYDRGTIFELSSQPDGKWKETILHFFENEPSPKGTYIISALLIDSAGNLYGTAGNGALGGGVVFELSQQPNKRWTETVLHSFPKYSDDGWGPSSALIMDSAGNLYGTTLYGVSVGGDTGYGTVYEVSPQQGGGWTEKVLHSFAGPLMDGEYPQANLIFDGAGNLYSTTQGSDSIFKCDRSGYSCGTVVEFSPQSGNTWAETVLHNFNTNSEGDGHHPFGYIVLDGAGNLFGTTEEGGAYTEGTVFEVMP
jgi:uncharacterized repeat protein (TIGR03803 family)